MSEQVTCIFCPTKLGDMGDGYHHVFPIGVRQMMGWGSGRSKRLLNRYKVPICRKCHDMLTLLQEPLVFLISQLTEKRPVPFEMAWVLDGVTATILKQDKQGEDAQEEPE